MLQTIFFDCDGVVVKRETYFSKRFARDFDIPEQKILTFFQGEFLSCEIGKADLKEELKKYLPRWNWKQSVDDLLKYWFDNEKQLDREVIDYIQSLRAQGIKCFMATNNEKYRTDFLRYRLALITVFDKIYSSCEIGYMKPQPEFWNALYRNEFGTKRDVLVVDDKPEFVESARKFGFYGHHYKGLAGLQKAVEDLLKV